MPHEEVILTRNCEAVQIPQGTPITLTQGTRAVITQALGETYTLQLPSQGRLVRITDKDADAIGKQAKRASQTPPAVTDGPLTEEMVWAQLRDVYDPEIPINVVDLGLIYDLRLQPRTDKKVNILVQMTLTAQGCGMGPSIARDAQHRIESLPGVGTVEVTIVWDPPWHPDMMSDEGKKHLGVYD
ncbi:MAG: putative Fe-S cluster assembly protein SufT [Candidatus Binatia bacterium]